MFMSLILFRFLVLKAAFETAMIRESSFVLSHTTGGRSLLHQDFVPLRIVLFQQQAAGC